MFYENDIVSINGCQFRVLHNEHALNRVWVINMEDKVRDKAFPEMMTTEEVSEGELIQSENILDLVNPTKSRIAVRDKAMSRIEPLVTKVPDIFYASQRGKLVIARAAECGCSDRTLYHDMRKYWLGGQTSQALLGNYHNSGTAQIEITANRGRPPEQFVGHEPRKIYQLTKKDKDNFVRVIEEFHNKSKVRTQSGSFIYLLNRFYTYRDGNNNQHLLNLGERPSLKQFAHFLRKKFPHEVVVRGQEGDKDFERDHRAVLGSVLEECSGIGDQYELDATIGDFFLVSATNRNKIIGKPVIYIIIDRKSRLIVGFSVGLMSASWSAAVEALTSISTDKQRLCEYYEVEYKESDWPAHRVFPKTIIADRGEMISHASDELVKELGVAIVNLPSLRPDWKPLVENSFKLLHESLKDGLPGYEPPANVTKRRCKDYAKDATLTLREFGREMLEYIIKYNNCPMETYPLSPQEIDDDVETSPVDLWNYGRKFSGAPQRRDASIVRNALLPRADATVEKTGVKFRGLYYSCDELLEQHWFVNARKKHFKVEVKFESGLVNTIYVLDKNNIYEATLTGDSKMYADMSFAELHYYQKKRKAKEPEIVQARDAAKVEHLNKMQETARAAQKDRKATNDGTSRHKKRSQVKAARQENASMAQKDAMTRARHDKEGSNQTEEVEHLATEEVNSTNTESAGKKPQLQVVGAKEINQVNTPPKNMYLEAWGE